MVFIIFGIIIGFIAVAVYLKFFGKNKSRPGLIQFENNIEAFSPAPLERPSLADFEFEQVKPKEPESGKELNLVKEIPVEPAKESIELKQPEVAESAELERLKQENYRLQNELSDKNLQLENSVSERSTFSEEAKKNSQQLQQVESENKQLTDRIGVLQGQIASYIKEIGQLKEGLQKPAPVESGISKEEYADLKKRLDEELLNLQQQKNINSDLTNKMKVLEIQQLEYNKELQKQEQLGEQVSKAEHEALRKELDQDSQKLEMLNKDNSDLINKIKVLEIQHVEYNKEIRKQSELIEELKKKESTEERVSKKEFDDLKKKLDTAEGVLRILHGADKENG